MNWLFKLLVSLIMLLSGVFIHLYCHAREYQSSHSHRVHLQSYMISHKSGTSDHNHPRQHAEPTITEDREDDDSTATRKILPITPFLISLFSPDHPGTLDYLKQCCSLSRYFSDTASFTCVILGVLKI